MGTAVRVTDSIAAIGLLPRVGVYRLSESGMTEGGVAIPVNLLDSRESAARSRDVVRLGSRSIQASQGDARPREIWHWFIMLATLVLAVEWFIFTARARI